MRITHSGQCFLVLIVVLVSLRPSAGQEPLTITHTIFEPFVWSEDDASKGIYVDVLTEALQDRLGIPVRFIYYPWKRAQLLVENGRYDGFVTLVTPARLEYTDACRVPVVVATMGIFTYANHPRFKEMETIRAVPDLAGYRLTTYLGHGWAKKHLDGYNVDYSGVDVKSVLRMIAAQRGDLTVEPVEVVLYNLKTLGLKNKVVQVPGVFFGRLEFKLMIGKQSPYNDIIPKVDRALTDMGKDGSLQAIYDRYR